MRKKYNEAFLKPGQRLAAELLLEREFADKSERLSYDEIAEKCGTSRVNLWRWKTQDENFIAYYQHRVDTYMKGEFGFVMRRLHDGIKSGSMKGIELYLKMAGALIEKQQIEIDDKSEDASEKQERLRERLAELEAQAKELDEGDDD